LTIVDSAVRPGSAGAGLLARYPLTFYFNFAYAGSWLVWSLFVLSRDGAGVLPFNYISRRRVRLALLVAGAFAALSGVALTLSPRASAVNPGPVKPVEVTMHGQESLQASRRAEDPQISRPKLLRQFGKAICFFNRTIFRGGRSSTHL
jgi:hypothetical protein